MFGASRPLRVVVRASGVGVGRRRGAKRVLVHAFFGPNAPARAAEWPLDTASSRTTVDLIRPDAAGNAIAWICCCWTGTTGERGPPSQPTRVRRPGTGLETPVAHAGAAEATPTAMKIAA